MANITRIKASGDAPKEKDAKSPRPPKTKTPAKSAKTDQKKVKAKAKKTPKTADKKRPLFLRILLAPLVPFKAFGRYIRDSWREIRQVRWPDRKLTWKMTLSVIIYVIIFAAVIMLLDALFTFMFNKLLGV